MSKLKFGGSVIDTENGEVKVKPDEEKVERIKNFPSPKTRAELKSFPGMARTFDLWTGNLVRLSSEMSKLQSEKNTFIWSVEHEKEFKKMKEELCSGGLGYVWVKRVGGNNRRIIKCGSTLLTDTQRRWSMVELELASMVYGLEKCSMYIMGASNIEIYNDQQVIVNLQHKNLADI